MKTQEIVIKEACRIYIKGVCTMSAHKFQDLLEAGIQNGLFRLNIQARRDTCDDDWDICFLFIPEENKVTVLREEE